MWLLQWNHTKPKTTNNKQKKHNHGAGMQFCFVFSVSQNRLPWGEHQLMQSKFVFWFVSRRCSNKTPTFSIEKITSTPTSPFKEIVFQKNSSVFNDKGLFLNKKQSSNHPFALGKWLFNQKQSVPTGKKLFQAIPTFPLQRTGARPTQTETNSVPQKVPKTFAPALQVLHFFVVAFRVFSD